MNDRDRFLNTMRGRPVDRAPFWEFAVWWDKTIHRWKQEGLPARLRDELEIRDYFELDRHRRFRVRPIPPTIPKPAQGDGLVADMEGYRRLRSKLFYDELPIHEQRLENAAHHQLAGELVLWITLDGFFWHPRNILGIEPHLVAFHETPELIHLINADLLDYYLERLLPQLFRVCTPDFIMICEDMSYRGGPMISRKMFDEFIAPYYRRLLPALKNRGVIPLIDTDGRIDMLAGWFLDAGADAFFPVEVQAGNNLVELHSKYPRARFIGGYDKRKMNQGEAVMRAEFERLLPLMRAGGYIPTTDHQVPPEVSLEEYRLYLRLLMEYCKRAGAQGIGAE